jgi:hypothetical protein
VGSNQTFVSSVLCERTAPNLPLSPTSLQTILPLADYPPLADHRPFDRLSLIYGVSPIGKLAPTAIDRATKRGTCLRQVTSLQRCGLCNTKHPESKRDVGTLVRRDRSQLNLQVLNLHRCNDVTVAVTSPFPCQHRMYDDTGSMTTPYQHLHSPQARCLVYQ